MFDDDEQWRRVERVFENILSDLRIFSAKTSVMIAQLDAMNASWARIARTLDRMSMSLELASRAHAQAMRRVEPQQQDAP
jgi:hypothetical protein